MKEIFEQYGAAIITVIVIVALAAVIGILLSTNGTVHEQFINLIDGFYKEVNPGFVGNIAQQAANNATGQ